VWSGGVCPLIPRVTARQAKFSLYLLMHYAMKTPGIKEGKAPRILDFGNKLWIAVSFTSGPLGTPPVNGFQVPTGEVQGVHRSVLDDMTIKTSWSSPQFAACCSKRYCNTILSTAACCSFCHTLRIADWTFMWNWYQHILQTSNTTIY